LTMSASTATSAEHAIVQVASSRFAVEVDGDAPVIGSAALLEWVRRSASIVDGYYGHFPAPRVSIRIVPGRGSGVRSGHAYPPRSIADGPTIHVDIGSTLSDDQLMHDWVLVHEMTHLALPDVGDDHAWLSEGIATYVEGVARVQAGNMSARALWEEYVSSMPKGMPVAGDEGLDRTHTWGRTYWGGALFCLVADISIRERTANRFGLQDALRSIATNSGGMAVTWPIEKVLNTGDASTGTTVLMDLYQSMATKPTAPNLPQLWARLGLEVVDGRVTLLTGTPQAAIRDAIARDLAPMPLGDDRAAPADNVPARVAGRALGSADPIDRHSR
jgi:hypothetical protein